MRLLDLLAVFGVLAVSRLSAQEHFEIAVYPYATAHRGEWELEGHLNLASRGTSGVSGTVAPTQGQWRFAAEVTRGITDHWEVAGYVLGAQVPGMGLEYAGWRLRSRMRAPESWRLPVNVAFSAEYETSRPSFSDSPRTAELTAIFERRFGSVQLLADPTFERDLVGAGHEWEFEPRARLGADVSKAVTLGLEWFGSFSDVTQRHQFFPPPDLRLADHMTLPVAGGFAGTPRGADTTVHRNAGWADNWRSPRGTARGFPFTFSVASIDVSLTMRYHAPRRSGNGALTRRRAHWNAGIAI